MRVSAPYSLVALAPFFFGRLAGACNNENGYTYCNPIVRAVVENVGHDGTYQETTGVNVQTGEVFRQPYNYHGQLAPFNGDLSVHFRGPLNLETFAVYVPNGGFWKRDVNPHGNAGSSAANSVVAANVSYTTMLEVVDIHEKIIVTSTLGGDATTSTQLSTSTTTRPLAPGQMQLHSTGSQIMAQSTKSQTVQQVQQTTETKVQFSPSTPSAAAATPASSSTVTSSPSSAPSDTYGAPSTQGDPDWNRVAYYDRGTSASQGLLFMNNRGGQGSGSWDDKFGNTLSFASSDAKGGASGPTFFSGWLDDPVEVAIFSDRPCNMDICGWARGPAYMGFGGENKLFLFRFSMPHKSNGQGGNDDMPAIWFLNGEIPRVAQYNGANCWGSGCGELDFMEVLARGSEKMIATVHDNNPTGFSDYFVRPTQNWMNAAVLMKDNNFVMVVLPDDFNMNAPNMAADLVNQIETRTDWVSGGSTTMRIP
jgi:Putative TOS1-like glycosyl hydrolase (DUF2401)/Glycine-rich protein domain (DUF2403)